MDQEPIYETNYFKIFLSIKQDYLGRCVILTKRHRGDLSELNNEEWLDFAKLVKKMECALKKAFDATMYNWTCLMNNAFQKEPPVPHVHWHFKPRYNHKVEFTGETFEDPEFGHHYGRNRKKQVSEEIKKEIIQKIKENL